MWISDVTTPSPKNSSNMVWMAAEAEPVGDVLVHRPALQPVEVLVQPLVSLGDEECAAVQAPWTDDRHSITLRLIPPEVSTRSNALLTLGIGQAASLLGSHSG